MTSLTYNYAMKSTGDLFQICSESLITTGDLSHAEMDRYSESFIEWWPLPSLCWMVSNFSPNLPFPQGLRQNFSDFKLNCWTGYHLAAPFNIFLSSTRWIETHHAFVSKILGTTFMQSSLCVTQQDKRYYSCVTRSSKNGSNNHRLKFLTVSRQILLLWMSLNC